MKRGSFALFIAAALAWLAFIPVAAFAQGLVQCTGLNCQACHLAQTAENIIHFLILLAVPITAVLIAVAGLLFFTSAENPGQRDRAKTLLRTALVGFLIALSSWLVVNTILTTLFDPDFRQGGSWFSIRCVADSARPTNKTVQDWLTGVLGSPLAPPVQLSVSGAGAPTACPPGSAPTSVGCSDEMGVIVPPVSVTGTGSAGARTEQWRTELDAACAQVGLADCEFARAIMANESNGNCGLTGPTGDYGCMQVTCGAAQSHDPSGWAQGRGCDEIRSRLLTDPTYNMLVGANEARICYNQFGGATANAAACYNGGVGAVRPSTTCIGQTVWACAANPGYQVTRNYVPRVLDTYSRFSTRR